MSEEEERNRARQERAHCEGFGERGKGSRHGRLSDRGAAQRFA